MIPITAQSSDSEIINYVENNCDLKPKTYVYLNSLSIDDFDMAEINYLERPPKVTRMMSQKARSNT